MISNDGRPPAWLERLVEALLGSAASTPFILGDLREEFRALSLRRSRVAACTWYLTHGARVAVRVRLEPRRPGPAVPGRPYTRRGDVRDVMTTDLRQSARFLTRRPALSLAVIVTVALAVSATTTVFAVVDGVLFEPLPYANPDRLVAIWETNPTAENRNVVSPANFLTWRAELESFDAMSSILETGTTIIEDGVPERVGWIQASADYFEMVGAQSVVGRLYGDAEDQPGGGSVVVLSEGYWQRRFGGDPTVVGRTIQLGLRPGGAPFEVIGVLDDRFDFDVAVASFGGVRSHELWLPPQFGPEAREAGGRYLQVVARLTPDATINTARQEADALAARLAESFPDRQEGWGVRVVSLHEDLVGDVRSMLFVVFGAVCFVLLIACANVANLLVSRASEREQEMAVRSAMGAGRGRLLRQLLIESSILSVVGGLVGIGLAQWALVAFLQATPDLPRVEAIGLDGAVLAFAVAAVGFTAILFGLAPAVSLGRPGVAGGLGTRGSVATPGMSRLRGGLVVVQVALSLMLLVGAGLLVRSLVNRLDVGVGFDVADLLTTQIQLGGAGYRAQDQALFFEELVERVEGLPGVRAASAVTGAPLTGAGSRTGFWRLDQPAPEAGEMPGADIRWVHRDYHTVMGISLRDGRLFQPSDDENAPLVVLVNETGAEQIWPGERAVGKQIAMPWNDTLVAEVVGVVGDVRHNGPDTDAYPMFYWEHRQFNAFNFMSLVVRTEAVPAATIVAGLRRELSELDPGIPLSSVEGMDELFVDAIRRSRLAAISLGLFALVALLLAGIGVYGVVAHATARRSREIGIRIALGAERLSIMAMVLREGMARIGLAIALGTLGAMAMTGLLEGMVFDVSTTDPVTFVGTVTVLAFIGFAATWVPALRASGIDPVESIRAE